MTHEAFAELADGAQYSRSRTVEDVEEAARERGHVVRWPLANELFIDLDSNEAVEIHNKLFAVFERYNRCKRDFTPSPSGREGRFHVVVTLDRDVENETERVALQAGLGSDPTRELLALIRIKAGCEPRAVSVFFERKG